MYSSEQDVLFIVFDKLMELIEYLYYEKEEKAINIELGNLYTIIEEEEELMDDLRDGFILM